MVSHHQVMATSLGGLNKVCLFDLTAVKCHLVWVVCISLGVLLLNACLTVREREPNSHAGKVSYT